MVEREMELVDYLRFLLRWSRFIVGCTLVVALVVFVINWRATKTYEAFAFVHVSESVISLATQNEPKSMANFDIAINNIITMARNRFLIQKAIQMYGLEKPPFRIGVDGFLKGIYTVSRVPETSFIRLHVLFPDAQKAAEIANFMAGSLVKQYVALSSVSAVSANSFMGSRLKEARNALEKAEGELVAAETQQSISALEDELKVDLVVRKAVFERLQSALNELTMWDSEIVAAWLKESQDEYSAFSREIVIEKYRQDKSRLVAEINIIMNRLAGMGTIISSLEAKKAELKAQLEKQGKVEVLTKSFVEEPVSLAVAERMAAEAGGKSSPSRIEKLHMRSEELNPVYQEIQKELVMTESKIKESQSGETALRARLQVANEELRRTNIALVEYDRRKAELGRADEMAKKRLGNRSFTSRKVLVENIRIFRAKIAEMDDNIKSVNTKLGKALHKRGSLTSQVNLMRANVDFFEKKFAESKIALASRAQELKLVDPAEPLVEPVGPRVRLNTALAAAGAFFSSIFFVFFFDYVLRSNGLLHGDANPDTASKGYPVSMKG